MNTQEMKQAFSIFAEVDPIADVSFHDGQIQIYVKIAKSSKEGKALRGLGWLGYAGRWIYLD